ncbi:MAG: ABC transporter substrate-binding protein [Solirubrobacteraceae bacterium]
MTTIFRMPGRSAAASLLALSASLLLAACGGSSSSTSASAASPSSPAPPTSSGGAASPSASGKPTLLVYSAQGYDKDTVAAFQKATGIPAKLIDDSTGPLLARIQAERANPQWGLLWVDGGTAFASLDKQGLLQKGLKVPQLTAVGQSLVPSDASFIPTGTTMACTVIYDSRAIKAPPTTWQQLLTSKFKGKVGMNDPAVSGPTYPCVAGLMNYLGGVSQGEAFFKQLKSNGLHVSQTNPDTLHLLQTGQISIALIQSSAAVGAAAKAPALKVGYLPKVTLLPGAIGVDRKAPAAVQQEAQQFIDFVLSPAGQKVMQSGDPTGDSLYWPVVAQPSPLSGLPPLSSVSSQKIDPYVWGPREPQINNWFTANIVH